MPLNKEKLVQWCLTMLFGLFVRIWISKPLSLCSEDNLTHSKWVICQRRNRRDIVRWLVTPMLCRGTLARNCGHPEARTYDRILHTVVLGKSWADRRYILFICLISSVTRRDPNPIFRCDGIPGCRWWPVRRLVIHLINRIWRRRDGYRYIFCLSFRNSNCLFVVSFEADVQMFQLYWKFSARHEERWIWCVCWHLIMEAMFVIPKRQQGTPDPVPNDWVPHPLFTEINIRRFCNFLPLPFGTSWSQFHTSKRQNGPVMAS